MVEHSGLEATRRFDNVLRSELEVGALMGGPVAPPVVEKRLSSLDRHCLTFIKRSPLVLIASINAEGRMEVYAHGRCSRLR